MNITTVQEMPVVSEMPKTVSTLNNLMEDGLYLVFMLREGMNPGDAKTFSDKVSEFLRNFERSALAIGKSPESIQMSKYAFCALMDEVVLSSDLNIRDEWELSPMQMRVFDEQLAGEGFFTRLDTIRLDPQKSLDVLEVYHSCLLLGFQGKYLLEGEEKLNYLIGRVGQEIAQIKGNKAEFAPSWKPVHRFQRFIRHEFPLWGYYALLGVVAILVFMALHFILGSQMSALS